MRIFERPERVRLFTVPSGSSRRAAISSCVRPSKYARRRTALFVLVQLAERALDEVAHVGRLGLVGGACDLLEDGCVRRRDPFIERPAAPPAVERPAARDREQPAPHGGAGGVEAARVAPGLDESLLQHVFGIPRVLEDTNAEAEKDRCVEIVERGERLAVTRDDTREEVVSRRVHAPAA